LLDLAFLKDLIAKSYELNAGLKEENKITIKTIGTWIPSKQK
jgi:hypothetical protein